MTEQDQYYPGVQLIKEPVTRAELKKIAEERFGDLVKAVVDVARGVMAVGGELHADEEAYLLDHGSEQVDLWGINIYPGLPANQYLEFDSMINVRPTHSNRSRGVDNVSIRERITEIVATLVKEK